MASLQDYLRSESSAVDARLENLAKGLSQSGRNQRVLQSLGVEDKSKKNKNFLTKALNIIGTPGRLITGGVLEAIGRPTSDLAAVSGMDQFKKLLTGEIQVSGSDLPGLQVEAGDSRLTRLAKGVGGFAADVALDPTSYVAAPASISRKLAAENLLAKASKVGFLDDIVSRSAKGEGLIDDLVKKTPLDRAAKIQEGVNAAADLDTPAEILASQGRKTVAAQQLASDLGTTFLTKGRKGLIDDLTALTGSRSQAVAVFKGLPEEIKGGLVLTLPTGKQIARLTPGTGRALGPAGTLLNTVRQGVGVAANPLTRSFSGKGAGILADVKTAEWYKRTGRAVPEEIANTRLIDYTNFKKAMAERGIKLAAIQGDVVSSLADIQGAKTPFAGADVEEFETAFRDHFFTPGRSVEGVESPAYLAGRNAAQRARQNYVQMYERAKAEGLDIGNIGDPYEYSSLMLTDEAYERMRKLGTTDAQGNVYKMDSGRRSNVEFMPDEEVRAAVGWQDPNNPGVTYLHAKSANDKLEEAAVKAGKSPEEAKKARIYIEDPALIMQKYGNYVANASASKRFVRVLEETGTVIKDIPEARRLLEEWTSSTMAAGVAGLMPEVKRFMETRAKTASDRLRKLVSLDTVEEQQKKIALQRQQILNEADAAKVRVADLRTQVSQATEEVAAVAPQISRLRGQLDTYAKTSREAEVALDGTQRAVKNVNARIGTARKNLEKVGDELDVAKQLREEAIAAGDPVAASYYDNLIASLGDDAADVQEKLAQEAALKQANDAELENIKQLRSSARQQGAADIEQQILGYEQAVSRRNSLVEQLTEARGARDAALAASRRVSRTIGLEQVTNLEGLVMGYVDAADAVKRFKMQNPITPAMDAAQKTAIKQQLKALEQVANLEKRVLTEVLRTGKTEFSEIAGDYAEQVIKAAEELSVTQFQAFMALTNEEKIKDLLGVIANGSREDAEVMKAIGDIYTSFKQIRDIIPEEAFDKLAKTQRELLEGSGFAKLRDKLIREEKQPGAIARGLVGEGYETLGKQKAMQNLYATTSVVDAMNSIYKSVDDPNAWEKFTTSYLDPFLSMWKVATTTGRGPAFVINNVMGGMFNNYIGNVPVRYAKLASDAMFDMRNAVIKLEKMYPNKSFFEINTMAEQQIASRLNKVRIGDKGMGDLFIEFNRMGGAQASDLSTALQRGLQEGGAIGMEAFRRGAPTSFVYPTPASGKGEEVFRSAIDKAMTWRGQRWMNDISQSSETFLRFQAFMDGYAKYGDFDAAMNKVRMLHFDYRDLGPGEEWLRRIIPFYTWSRNNVPLQLRTLVLQPGKIQRFMYAQENLQKTIGAEGEDSWMNEVMPEWLSKNNGFITLIDTGGGKLGVSNKLPFGDINTFLKWEGAAPELDLAGAVSGLGPGLRVPLEVATGRDLATGIPSTEGAAEKLVKDIIPQLGVAQRVITAADYATPGTLPFSKEGKGLSETLSLLGLPALVGLQAQAITPKQITGELYRRGDIQSQQIADTAAAMNVDLDWVRKRLDKGVPPQIIATMVRSGAGRLRPTPGVERSEMTQAARKKALAALEGL
jgi:hypothetical protein